MASVSLTNIVDKILERAVAIQQIPGPTFAERQRALYVKELFEADGLADVGMDEDGNVYGRLPGAGLVKPLVVSAHLDTVFPAETDLTVHREPGKIFGPGIGDNSLGVAGLFGLAWIMGSGKVKNMPAGSPQHRYPGDVWLVANVGEEGLGDLCGMRAVVDRFKDQVSAYIILEGMALGQIYHRALGVRRYRITARTAGGHSWVNFGSPSAIHELAALVVALTSLHLPKNPRTTLNVGMISGGTSVNTIAPEAHLELDLRSEGSRTLSNLAHKVEEVTGGFNSPGVEMNLQVIGSRPAGNLSVDHPLVQLAQVCLLKQGLKPKLNIGSTDANIPLSLGLPAVCIGLTNGSGAHTVQEHMNIEPLAQGLGQLVSLVEGAFRLDQEVKPGG